MKVQEKSESTGDIVTVRPEKETMTRQNLPYFVGISADSAGTRSLSMSMVIIPPGGTGQAHCHKGFETAIYVLEGEVKTLFGEGLKQSVINKAGDFVYIPPDVPHQPFNLSNTQAARAIVARNDACEQENVVLYPENQ